MNENAKKRLKSAGAVTLAAALLLTGTFAWSNSIQSALNETLRVVNPGGRLHDDFDGTNKDIYVENFGSQNIYARVKLTEYMEIGVDANKNTASTSRNATSVVEGKKITEPENWTAYFKEADKDGKEAIEKYFKWTTNGGSTTYMPTFNKSKDSTLADINGMYINEVGNDFDYKDYQDGNHYTDYIDYSNAKNSTVEGYEILDADDNTTDELTAEMLAAAKKATDNSSLEAALGTALTGGNVKVEKDGQTSEYVKTTHTAKATETAAATKTVEEFNKLSAEEKAAYKGWIIDTTDGWAYWSQAIEPGTATGLLLDSIGECLSEPGENWYYAVNAEAEFITYEDKFGGDANTTDVPSDAAKTALKAIGVTGYDETTPDTTAAEPTTTGDTTNGSVSYTANKDGTYTATITPIDGKEIESVKVNNSDVTASVSNNQITNVPAGATVEVTYKDKATTPSQDSTDVATAKAAIKAATVVTAATTDLGASTVTIDNKEYIVIARDSSSATLLQKDIITNMAFDADSNVWEGSDVQKYLNSTDNGNYLADKPTLAEMAKTTKLHTANKYDRSGSYTESNDKVYLLSEADVFGTANMSTVADNKEYTNGSSKMDLPSAVLNTGWWWFLRSPRYDDNAVAGVSNIGGSYYVDFDVSLSGGGVRPALTVNL